MNLTNCFLIVFLFLASIGCSSNDDNDPGPDTLSDLELSLSVNNVRPEIGSNIQFSILISNKGPGTAMDIVVENILPDGYAYIEDDGGSAYNQSNGTWSISEIGVNDSLTLNITVKVNASGDYNNVVEIIASGNEDPDSVPDNGNLFEDDLDEISLSPLLPSTVEVTTLAILKAADALALDSQGLLYAANYGQSKVYTIESDGSFSTFLSNQPGAAGITFDSVGNFYLARYESADIIKRDANTGSIEVFASSVAAPIALDFDSRQNLYTNNNVNNFITRISPEGNKEIIDVAVFNNSSLAIDEEDNIYVSDYASGVITKIDAATNAQSVFVNIPVVSGGIAFIIYSKAYFYATALADGTIYQIDKDGNVKLIAGISSVTGTTDGNGNTATFDQPIGIIASEDGNTLYVAQNGGSGAIRVITGFND